MSRTFRVQVDSPAAARALADIITDDGGFATYFARDRGAETLAVCRTGTLMHAMAMLGLRWP